MQRMLLVMLLASLSAAVFAQPPAGDRSVEVQKAQRRASAANAELEQARYELKLAEQDYVNTQDAYRAAPPPANDIKRELDKMKKALDAAKTKETRARKAYDAALEAVDRVWGRPPKTGDR